MSWGKEWPVGDRSSLLGLYSGPNPWPDPITVGIDLGSKPSQTITAIIKDGQIEKVYNNKVPTHDPYTNPNSHIYYQCKCGDILDPGTKSFAALNNCASEKGWKVRWSKDGQGYEPFCVECGEDVE